MSSPRTNRLPSLAAGGRYARHQLSLRFRELRRSTRVIAQATAAATLAFWVAQLIGHTDPFFAPIAALATVAISLAQRMRRASELVLGNAIGIALADWMIAQIGTGTWQLGLVVALALIGANLAGGGPILIMQASSAAVLIATITPPTADQPINSDRFVDALIGGIIGLVVSALFMPPDPARTAQRATQPVLDALEQGLSRMSQAAQRRDTADARAALVQLRATAPALTSFQNGLAASRESVRMAPWYWSQRGVVAAYSLAGFHLDNTLRNLRVLARHLHNALDRDEEVPAGLPEQLDRLAAAVQQIGHVLVGDADPESVQTELLEVVAWAAQAPEAERAHGPFSAPIRIQVRIAAADLLQASGLNRDETVATVRAMS